VVKTLVSGTGEALAGEDGEDKRDEAPPGSSKITGILARPSPGMPPTLGGALGVRVNSFVNEVRWLGKALC